MTRRKPKPATEVTPAAVHPETPTEPAFVPPAVSPVDHPPAVPAHPPGDEHHGPDNHPHEHRHDGGASHADAHRPDGPRVPNPFGFRQDAVAGVRLLEDRRFKQVQLKFADKPSDAVRQAVREAGFRWLQEAGVWAKQIDRERGWQTRAEAEEVFGRVAALIREEKGLTREHA